MDLTLNELSIAKISSKEKTIEILRNAIILTRILFNKGFQAIRIVDRHQFLSFEFAHNFTLYKWLNQKNYSTETEKTASQLLRVILARRDDGWTEEEQKIINDYPLIAISLDSGEEISDGIKLAYVLNTISISLNTSNKWDSPFLNIINLIETNGNFEKIPDNVIHSSVVDHLDMHKDWIEGLIESKKLISNWNPTKNLFPHLEYSNLCVSGSSWDDFRRTIREAPQEEKKALIIKMARQVAHRNGYMYDQKISELNKRSAHIRIIYSGGVGKEKMYLSFDLETGGFEVCNYLGEHQGEYFFDGTKQKDSSADHGIKVH
jgi:hypothetical protein